MSTIIKCAVVSQRALASCALLVVLMSDSPAAAQDAWIPFGEAVEAATDQGQVLMVMVGAPWCGPCHRMRTETFMDASVDSLLQSFMLTELTIDDAETRHRVDRYRLSERDWAERLGADVTPTFLFMRPDLSVFATSVGFLPPEGFIPILESVQDASLASAEDQ